MKRFFRHQLYVLCFGLMLCAVALPLRGQAPISYGHTTINNNVQFLKFKAAADATSITFTLCPEPLTTDRTHYPIVFIEWHNGTSRTQQMINLSYDMTFTLPLAADKTIAVWGEPGIWAVKANGQKITHANLTGAQSLRALELNDNLIGTATGSDPIGSSLNQGYWNFAYLPNLRFLSLNRNYLTSLIGISPSSIKVLELSGNRFTEMPFFSGSGSSTVSLAALDLSLNMLDRDLPNLYLTWDPGTTTAGAPFESVHSRAATQADSLTMRDDVTYQSRYLDLSHNRIPMAKIPRKPTNLPEANYLVSYQERFLLPVSNTAGEDGKTGMFTMRYPIQIPQDYRRFQGIAATPQPTTIKWYVEKNATTDEYEEIPSSYYTMDVNYNFRFQKHPTGDINSNIFAVAIPADGTLPAQVESTAKKRSTTMWVVGTKNTLKMQSYERTNVPNASSLPTITHALDKLLDQPGGTATTMTFLAGTDASLVGNAITGDGTDRTAENRFYRSNVIQLDPYTDNYWHGTVSNAWNDPRNWTNNVVPITTKDEYMALDATKRAKRSSVTFATASNNSNNPAIRDLELDQDRYIFNYNNTGERQKTISIPPALTLYHEGSTNNLNNAFHHLKLRAAKDLPNGSYIYIGSRPEYNAVTHVELEFYAKGDNSNLELSQTKWQYLGLPIRSATTSANRGNVETMVYTRKYNRTKVGQYDEKWEGLSAFANIGGNENPVEHAYQISQPKPTTHRFFGHVERFRTASFHFEGSSSPTNYDNMNLFANPYLAAMPIASLVFPNSGVEKTVYLFNTGSREQWLAGSGGTTPNNIPGSYTAAIPTGLAGYLPTMPQTIPTLSTFMVKASGSGTITFPYTALVSNTEVNRARRAPETEPSITSLTIDLTTDSVAYDRLWLVTAEGTTKDYENGYDAEKFIAGNMAQLYAMGSTNYQVLATDNIHGTPLAVTSGPKERELTLRFHIERPDQNVNTYYVDDLLTGATITVQDGDSYKFKAKPTDPLHRFTVRTNNVTSIGKTQTAIEIVAIADRTVEVRNNTDAEATAKVYDVKGVLLETLTIAPGEKVATDVDMPGFYIVQATNGTVRSDARLLLK